MNSLADFIQLVVGNDQARFLGVLILANLLLGVGQAIVSGTFNLLKLSDWARTRLLPVFIVYSVGVLISWGAASDPILGKIKDLIFTTESAVLIGMLLGTLNDFGIKLPTSLTGKNPPMVLQVNPLPTPPAPPSATLAKDNIPVVIAPVDVTPHPTGDHDSQE